MSTPYPSPLPLIYWHETSIRYYLSDRFRLRFEDSGLEEMMDENGEIHSGLAETIANSVIKQVPNDEAIDVTNDATEAQANVSEKTNQALLHGQIRTLDGEVAGDEFASDAINYQVLLGKIDTLLEKLKLDAWAFRIAIYALCSVYQLRHDFATCKPGSPHLYVYMITIHGDRRVSAKSMSKSPTSLQIAHHRIRS